jgi:hypothetical protein
MHRRFAGIFAGSTSATITVGLPTAGSADFGIAGRTKSRPTRAKAV